jgi:two-component sensor histidine kinase
MVVCDPALPRGEETVASWRPSCWPDAFTRVSPYSFTAAALAAGCFGAATLLRMVVGCFGVEAPFSTFFPAVLIAALLAGTPAAVAVIVSSAFLGWWTFSPSEFEFSRVTATDIANIAIFVGSSGLIVFVAHLYRSALQQLQDKDSERDLLMSELQHRGRNTYAIVESIVRSTLGSDREKADAIASRVKAVSSANDLVNWSNASNRTVSLNKLLALVFGANAERIFASGPNVELSPGATRTLSLVFHELLTNAMKYGALSNPKGTIAIQWTLDDTTVQLEWIEMGGPPISKPSKAGFGTTVVTRSLAALCGNIGFVFDSAGLRCEIEFDPTG